MSVVCGQVLLQKEILIRHEFQKDWTTCSKYGNYSRFNSQHNWGYLYEHLAKHENLYLCMSSKDHEESGYGSHFELLTISNPPLT